MPSQPDRILKSAPESGTVYVELSGRLGNQMFQAATAIALALRTGRRFAYNLADLAAKGEMDFYGLGIFPHGQTFSILSEEAQNRPGTLFEEAGFHYDERIEALAGGNGDIYLKGRFQTPRYFDQPDAADHIRAILDLAPHLPPAMLEFGTRLAREGATSVHVRRGDYKKQPHLGFHGLIAEPYYGQATSLIRRIEPETPLYVFSDSPNEVAELFADTRHVSYVSGNSMYEDLYLMQCCRHHIVANSTFSWWGAWLKPCEGKITIAPRQWFSREAAKSWYFGDVCPEGWVLL